jgi:hypothetical protein
MKSLFLLAIIGALAGCTAAGNYAPTATTEQDNQMVQKAFRARLADPEGVQLRNVQTFVNPGNVRMTCGMVNAKNAFGGYIGYQTFGVLTVPNVDYSKPFIIPVFVAGTLANIDCGGAGYQNVY